MSDEQDRALGPERPIALQNIFAFWHNVSSVLESFMFTSTYQHCQISEAIACLCFVVRRIFMKWSDSEHTSRLEPSQYSQLVLLVLTYSMLKSETYG